MKKLRRERDELRDELREIERELDAHYSDMLAGRADEIEADLAHIEFTLNDIDSPLSI